MSSVRSNGILALTSSGDNMSPSMPNGLHARKSVDIVAFIGQ